ncbi:TIGR03086 family metal-binding protein [Streptomyces sp. NPDC048442]|uniref:TIGR03086 family metal-binding protein n=1 Tax=Streptomyces sp. NPDC048442 TaxID=3154823 RepID=UPI00343FEEB5
MGDPRVERMHVGDSTFWSIGEVARTTGLTVKLIRHWSDIGVVHPAHRTPAGYRLYGTDALARLQLAQTLRGLGLGPAAVRDVLEREGSLAQVAATHVDALEAQIRTLRTQQAVLRSVTRRDTTAEGLITMTELARMSAAERRTVIHDFVTGALGGLDVPAYRRGLPAAAPDLPADPTDEQVDAWLELGELVRGPALRAGLRRMARYAAEHPAGESADGATGAGGRGTGHGPLAPAGGSRQAAGNRPGLTGRRLRGRHHRRHVDSDPAPALGRGPSGVLHACEVALNAVHTLVEAVEPGQFGLPTPCAEWDVRALLDHLVRENLLWSGLADGTPRSDSAADHLGDDHVAAFRAASRTARSAFGRPGMLEQRYGPAPGRRLVEQLTIEMLLHGWDLARALGRPFEGVGPLAEAALPVVAEIYGSLPRTAGGSFGPPQPVPEGASPLDRLAASLGRTVSGEDGSSAGLKPTGSVGS